MRRWEGGSQAVLDGVGHNDLQAGISASILSTSNPPCKGFPR